MRAALTAFGLDPDGIPGAARRRSDVLAYAELHIEQGPVLEAEGLPVGVVTAINGASRLAVEIEGLAGHAGTVPMSLRRDALAAAAECVLAIESRCASEPDLVGTVGRLEAAPGATNVIPGNARFTIDVRAPRDEQRLQAVADIEAAIAAICSRRGVRVGIRRTHEGMTAACAPWLQDQIGRAIEAEGLPRASAAFRRGPRRDGDRRPCRHRHAVRPLRGRHQPQPAGGDHGRRRRTVRARLPALHRAISTCRLEARRCTQTPARAIEDYLAAQRDHQTRFLAELVKVPSDNPPGDCAPHAQRAAELLEGLGFVVERHPVPADVVRANGMISATNLVVRERFGPGPTIALNAHGDVVPPGLGLDQGSVRRDGRGRLHVRPRRRGVEVRLRDLQLMRCSR